jgi:pimeloyl-ACP methyl ester carboxylesterase
VIAASTGSVSDKEIADFSARIEIPELRKLPAVYREVGASYRGANPDGTRRWVEIDEHSRQKDAPSQPLRTPNTFAKIETIPTSTLVIAADADLLAPPALMRIWSGHLKNHEGALIPDSGHAIAWEHPDLFNATVLQFVKRH